MNFTLTADKAKNQAKLLAAYLAGLKRKIPHGNALEAVAQMYGAKSWNVLSAQLEGVEATPAANAVGQATAQLHFLVENGQRVPAEVRAEVHSDDRRAETNFDAATWMLKASDDEILALASIDWSGDEAADVVAEASRSWDAEVEAIFTYLEAANHVRSDFDDTIGFEVSVNEEDALRFLRAFRYSLFVKVALLVSFGSQESIVKHGFLVEQRDAGKWGYCATHHRSEYLYDTEEQAWSALGIHLERFPHEWTESRLNSSNRVKNSSGTTVAVVAEQESTVTAVLGRRDDKTGGVLVLKQGDPHLSRETLRNITNDCEFQLQVAVPVELGDLIDYDIEFLNDQVSEAITGSSCDLTSLDFKRYSPENEAALIDMTKFVFILVSANWEPSCGIEGEDED